MNGLQLNYLELKFNKDQIAIAELNYENKEWFAKLKEMNKDKIFKRDGNKVYYWNRDFSTMGDLISGAKISTIDINEHPFIFCRIIESYIIYKMSMINGYRIWLDKYSNVWKIEKETNLYTDEGLAVYRVISFNMYFNSFNDQKTYGIVVNTELKTRFIKNKYELENFGFDTRGLNGKDEIIFANKKALNRYLESTQTSNKYNTLIKTQLSNNYAYKEINKFNSWLKSVLYNQTIFNNLTITYCKTNIIPSDNDVFDAKFLNKPVKYFCDDSFVQNGDRLYVNEAIKKFKPYNYSDLKNEYNIAIVCPAEHQGVTEDFIKKIEQRLLDTFHLSKINFISFIAKTTSLESYREAIYSKSLSGIDLAIVVVLDKFKEIEDNKSPYLFTKSKFFNHEIPTQEVRLETMLASSTMLPFTLNNISLNIFAKLGGIPWVVEKLDNIKQEFIIGISSTLNKDNKKIFGVATVFEFNGKYYQSDCVPLSDYYSFEDKNEYAKKLELTISHLIEKVKVKENVRFIFHLTKSPSNKYEIKAINNILQKYENYNVQYALIKIGYFHNFRLFKNEGLQYVSDGQYVRISCNEALVQFKGSDKNPVRFTLHKDSTFKDMYALVRQVYWFSYLSYRSYKPARKPVTTLYPWLITSLLEKMKSIEGLDRDMILRMEDKLWFI